MAKRKSVKKVSKKPMAKSNMKMDSKMNSGMKCKSCWHWFWAKLSVIAGVLFLITVWPWLNRVVMSVGWGWYLGAMILFCILHWSMHGRYHRM